MSARGQGRQLKGETNVASRQSLARARGPLALAANRTASGRGSWPAPATFFRMEENSPGWPGNDGAAGTSGGLGDVDMDKDRAKMEAEAAAAEAEAIKAAAEAAAHEEELRKESRRMESEERRQSGEDQVRREREHAHARAATKLDAQVACDRPFALHCACARARAAATRPCSAP